MTEIYVNGWAVLVAGVAQMALGALWYSPAVFGKAWMEASGMTPEKMETGKKGVGKSYFIGFVSALVTAYVLARVVEYAGAVTFAEGALVGFWLWLGIAAPVKLGDVLWEMKLPKYWVIAAGYYLVALALAAGIIAAW